MARILVVGAGFAGAVYARELADRGHEIVVIDRRDHIAGNCYDLIHPCGVRYHFYGPHLFHTSNQRVIDWLSRFSEWLPYEFRAKTRLPDGRLAPMPINRETVNAALGTTLETPLELREELARRSAEYTGSDTAEQFLLSSIGPELTEIFYRPYCRKMWDLDLSQISPDLVSRLSIREDLEDRYFPKDTFQALPMGGYTKLFDNIFKHNNIIVELNLQFTDDLANNFESCFNSMSIDEYFHFDIGKLLYRSAKFQHIREIRPAAPPPAAIISTDNRPYKRETWWHIMPGHDITLGPEVLRTTEAPCEFLENSTERFYPVKTSDRRDNLLYRAYANRPCRHPDMHFIGRCGTYQYLDMHQVINQSLIGARKWLAGRH